MGDLSVIFYVFKEKIVFKNHKLKSNQSLKKYAHTYGTPVFAPDFNATVLKAYLHVRFEADFAFASNS